VRGHAETHERPFSAQNPSAFVAIDGSTTSWECPWWLRRSSSSRSRSSSLLLH